MIGDGRVGMFPEIGPIDMERPIKQPWRHHTALSQSNINRKPLTHIISHSHHFPTLYIKTPHCFQQFSSNSIHSEQLPHTMPIDSIIWLFQSINAQNTSFPFARYFSQTCLTANTWSMHPLPCPNPHCSSPISHSVPALTILISTLPNNLPTTLN